jgi:hypothetical protein
MKNNKLRIAIDIRDVIQRSTEQYARIYKNFGINSNFDENNLIYTEGNFYSPFTFKSKKEKDEFEMEHAFELNASPNVIDNRFTPLFITWLQKLPEFESEKEIEVAFFGCGIENIERHATLFFLSKANSRVKKIYFPESSTDAWENADIIITANPFIIHNKPFKKTVIKIKTPYNTFKHKCSIENSKCCGVDKFVNRFYYKSWIDKIRNKTTLCYYAYHNIHEFLEDETAWKKILKIK